MPSLTSRLLPAGAMTLAAALFIGMSLPASAYGPAMNDAANASERVDARVAGEPVAQSIVVSPDVAAGTAARDGYDVLSWSQMLVQKYGTRDYRYAASGGRIRWPFPVEVPISSGYGERAAPCQGCSSMHMGLDFQPPNNSPIYAIADGVVKLSQDDAYGYGNHVYIDHGNLMGDGANVTTLYAHMQHGSVPLAVGQTVKAGDFIGLVGSTGTATGIHLHFELLLEDVQVDPFLWLKANAQ